METTQQQSRTARHGYDPAWVSTMLAGESRARGGKYNALVDFSCSSMMSGDDADKSVQGSAYLVKPRGEEDALRYYETDWYEVVRCRIEFLDGLRGDGGEQQHGLEWINGLTFGFIG